MELPDTLSRTGRYGFIHGHYIIIVPCSDIDACRSLLDVVGSLMAIALQQSEDGSH